MQLVVCLALRGILLCVEYLKALFHAGVVNAQELVLRGGHVDKIRLTLVAFSIEELVHRIIRRGLFQVGTDDLVQRFPKMRRAAFGRRDAAFGAVLAGLVYSRIDASEAHDRDAAGKTAYIPNLSHELRGSGFANTVHGQHSIVLRQLLCKSYHLGAQSGQCHLAGKQLLRRCGDKQFRVVVLR